LAAFEDAVNVNTKTTRSSGLDHISHDDVLGACQLLIVVFEE